MRVLKFEGDTTEYYAIFYEGLAATHTQGPQTRIVSRIFTKLDEYGKPRENIPALMELKDDKAIIILEDAEYDTAKLVLDKVEWSGLGAKKAGKMLDWLDAIPQETLKAEK